MSESRARIVHDNLIALLDSWDGQVPPADRASPVRPGSRLTGYGFLELLESQFQSRWLDLEARALKVRNDGFYTIASAGHEGNAAVAAALRPTDPCFLHYRSGGFFAQRARQVSGQTPIFDVLLSLCAAADDPISGGRHKVFGSVPLAIHPQTSTIASHLPKAMGAAVALERSTRLGLSAPVPADAVIVCSFGDATLNHSTAVGAINTVLWATYQHLPMPILFVCEDNGLGISVYTPESWIRTTWGDRPGLHYVEADGLDLVDAHDQAVAAVERCRRRRVPVFLHLRVVRLLGHAGSDVELAYRSIEEIKQAEARDPLLASCRTALETGLATAGELRASWEEIGERVRAAAREAARRPHLDSAAAVVAPLAPYSPDAVRQEAERRDYRDARSRLFGGDERLPEGGGPHHLAQLLNWGLLDLMAKYPEMLLFGEDVARRGGVYGVTAGLVDKIGNARVFNTLLDEQSILGLAIGAAQLGFLPVPEIQYLAYYHNAEDQVRGEAASLQFFSQGQLRNPMVVRIAAWAYQKGFGGHFHNDNSIAALRDVPGIVIASPARGDDAVGMLRTCLALARVDGRVVIFLEPIALYMQRDLHDGGDGAWLCDFPPPGEAVELGRARVWCDDDADDDDLTIVSWSNGLWRSLRAARQLRRQHEVRARVVDLRWLQPLDRDTLIAEARRTGRILVVDEGRRTGGLSEGIYAALIDEMSPQPPLMARTTAEDTFVPLGPAWNHVLPSESTIVEAALTLVRRRAPDAAAVEP